MPLCGRHVAAGAGRHDRTPHAPPAAWRPWSGDVRPGRRRRHRHLRRLRQGGREGCGGGAATPVPSANRREGAGRRQDDHWAVTWCPEDGRRARSRRALALALSRDNQDGCRVASSKNAPQADCRCLTSGAPDSGDRRRRGHGGKRNLFAPVPRRLLAGLSEEEPSKAPMPRLRLEPPRSSPVAAQRCAEGAGLDGGAPCRSTIGGAVGRSIPAVTTPPGERMQPPAPATAVSKCTFLAASTTAGVDIDGPSNCLFIQSALPFAASPSATSAVATAPNTIACAASRRQTFTRRCNVRCGFRSS